jgi:hypothetical protein
MCTLVHFEYIGALPMMPPSFILHVERVRLCLLKKNLVGVLGMYGGIANDAFLHFVQANDIYFILKYLNDVFIILRSTKYSAS